MRDPKRIDRILKLINELWKKSSDQRFGQFLINNGLADDAYWLWGLEDDKLEKALKDPVKKGVLKW